MKIAWVIDNLKLVGGAQRALILFTKTIQGKNIQLAVVSLQENSSSPLPQELRDLGARVILFPGKKLRDPARLWRLARYFKQEKFDVIHTHLTYANILGVIAGRAAGTPVIASLHSAHVDNTRFPPIVSKIEAFLLRFFANHVMAVGYTTAKEHTCRLGNRKITVIQNGVESPSPISLMQKVVLRKEMTKDQTRKIIITVGRLVEEKGYPYLIQAFSLLQKIHPETALVFVGSGVLEKKLQDQVISAGLSDVVTFLGTRRDVPDLLASSDIYVNSSIWEGLPFTILEGMAAGLPVVATDVGDNAKVIVKGTGLIVPPKQPQRLCAALSILLEDQDLMKSYGSTAKAHVAQNYNLDTWCERLFVLYRSVLPRSKFTPIQAN
jgi:glycosyltransferase involved in cell wall biosynthesis